MRMILNIKCPAEPFNSLVRQGKAGDVIGRILEQTKPESIYFTEQAGRRGAIAIVDVSDPSQVPVLAEPWFLAFNAECEFRIAMTPDDLAKSGIDSIGNTWGS